MKPSSLDTQQAAALLWETLDASDDMVLALQGGPADQLGTILTANGAFCRAVRLDYPQIAGSPLENFLAPDNDAATYASLRAAVRDRKPLRTQLLCRRGDGRQFWFGLHLMPAHGGEPDYFVVLGRDITESLHERQQQGAIQSLLAKVFLSVQVPVAIITDDGLVQMANPALEALLGYPPGALVGNRATDYIAPKCRSAILQARQHQLQDGHDYTIQTSVLRSDNTERSVELTSAIAHRDDLKRFRIVTLLQQPGAPEAISVHVAGKIRLIGLQEVKSALGSRWPKIAAKALATAEHVISQRCGRGESYSRTPEDDFLICFGEAVGEEEAAFRAAVIAKAIKVRLIGEGQTEAASHVTAITATVELPDDQNRSQDTFTRLLSERLNTQLATIEANARKTLREAVTTATCELEPIWGRRGNEPVAYYGQLAPETDQRVQAAYCALHPTERAGFDYDRLVLGVVADQAAVQLASGLAGTIFATVWYDTFLDRHCMERYLATCNALDQRLREHIMFVIAGIPKGCPLSRVLDCTTRLRPMCRGIALQFETLDIPEFDIAALGSPIVCVQMNDSNLEDPRRIAQLTKLVQSLHAFNSRILVRQTGVRDQTQQMRKLGVDLISGGRIASPHSG